MSRESFGDQLWNGLADAVADLRERHEEAWFGRAVTERGEAPEWPQAREAEPQSTGLNGDILGPEVEPMQPRDSAGLLEHGYVLNAEAMQPESTSLWPQAREALTYNPEQERDRSHEPDMDIDR